MLRGDQLASRVKLNHSETIQTNHLNKCPSSILTRINPSFTLAIDTQTPNPAKVYESEMKSLLMEDLKNGIRERTHSLKRHQEQKEQQKKEYREKVNGVLSELEKNNLTYSLFFQNRLNRQQQRKKLFIDEDRLKNSKINQFIEKREDKDVFNHGNDLYQQYQRRQQQNSLYVLEKQKEDKMNERKMQSLQKQDAFKNRKMFESALHYQNIEDKKLKLQRQHEYKSELSHLVQEKHHRDSLDQKLAENIVTRHNPITNPIPFHIENPYFIKRMQDNKMRTLN